MNINNGDFYYVRLLQQTLSLGRVDLRQHNSLKKLLQPNAPPPICQILTSSLPSTLYLAEFGLLPPVQQAPVIVSTKLKFSLHKWLSGTVVSCQTYNVRSLIVLDILFQELTIV